MFGDTISNNMSGEQIPPKIIVVAFQIKNQRNRGSNICDPVGFVGGGLVEKKGRVRCRFREEAKILKRGKMKA